MGFRCGLLHLILLLALSACSRTAIPEGTNDFFGQEANPFLPKITLYGDNPLTLDVFASYQDPGAVARSLEEGLLAPTSISVSGTLNSSVLGTYELKYEATDSFGRKGSAIRLIQVVDRVAPSISYQGTMIEIHEEGSPFVDTAITQGLITALDQYDGNLSGDIQSTSNVNPNQEGDYVITYNVIDSSDNSAIPLSRTVQVRDRIAPSVTIGSFSPENIQAFGGVSTIEVSFVGAAASSLDGKLALEITGGVSGCQIQSSPQATPHTYEVTITGCSGAGTAKLRVLSGAAQDDAQIPGPNMSAETLSTSTLNVSTPAPVAMISGAPTGFSKAPSLSVPLQVSVFGENVTQFRYKVGQNISCSNASGYSNAIADQGGIDITTNSGVGEGTYRLCVVGGNASGQFQSFATATTAEWTRDVTAPTISFASNLWPSGIWTQKICDLNQNFAASNPSVSGVSFLDNLDPQPSGGVVQPVVFDRLDAGDYNLSFQSQDAAGNSTTVAKTIRVSGDFVSLGGEIFDYGVSTESDFFEDRPSNARPSILDAVMNDTASKFLICNSITFTQSHAPLGSIANQADKMFGGSLDGKNYLSVPGDSFFRLIDLQIEAPLNEDEIGLFAGIRYDNSNSFGRIKNLVLENATISAHDEDYVGAVAGVNRGLIDSVAIIGGSVFGHDIVGGIVGHNASVTSNNSQQGRIERSFVAANVSGGFDVGGIAGQNSKIIANSFAYFNGVSSGLTGSNRIGGLVGYAFGNSSEISTSYAVASGICNQGGSPLVGGLVGDQAQGADVIDSFWDKEIAGVIGNLGDDCDLGLSEGTPATTMQLQTPSFFPSSWNGQTVWNLAEQSYPELFWKPFY